LRNRSSQSVELPSRQEDRRPRSKDIRSLLSPRSLLLAGAVAALFGTCVIGAGGYMLFHDDLLKCLLDRQIEMQYAYEDQLAAARLQLDQALTRQVLDQDSVEGKIEKLILRETMLETRAAAVAELVERFAQEGARESSSAAVKTSPALPKPTTTDALTPQKPQPEDWDLRLGGEAETSARVKGADHARLPPAALSRPSVALASAADPGLPLEARLDSLATSLDRTERDQSLRLKALARPAIAAANRLRSVFDLAGLSADRFVARASGRRAAMGGPFIAADEPSPAATTFQRDLAAAQSAVGALDRLRRALPSLPLRKPLNGELRLTSGFGYRADPFLGRPALHSGVDLLDDYGEPVRAAASGTVVAAGPSGGYGNMVEVDHGSGFSTRYGHLSQIDVTPGQSVAPGAILGRVGSTGRSTGAHLHYEVRTDGEAVDPARFLRAATALNEMRE
jgi:murein DD-endopeptidase MepM/ murein hydrolase activator NlpD